MTRNIIAEMAWRTFQPLTERLTPHNGPQAYSAEEIRELVLACDVGATVLDRLWGTFAELTQHGLERRRLLGLLKEIEETVGVAASGIYPAIHAIATSHVLSQEEQRETRRTIAELGDRAAAMQRKVHALRQWLERPSPVLDLQSLRDGALPEDRRYDDVRDVIASLHAGG